MSIHFVVNQSGSGDGFSSPRPLPVFWDEGLSTCRRKRRVLCFFTVSKCLLSLLIKGPPSYAGYCCVYARNSIDKSQRQIFVKCQCDELVKLKEKAGTDKWLQMSKVFGLLPAFVILQ